MTVLVVQYDEKSIALESGAFMDIVGMSTW